MSTVYDTGVLIAADRSDRRVWADHRVRLEAGLVPVTTAPVVAQASRSPRQVQLQRFLRGCDVVAFGEVDAHAVGALLAKAGTTDVVDAHVVVIAARDGAVVVTSDPCDLRSLAAHVRPRVAIRTTEIVTRGQSATREACPRRPDVRGRGGGSAPRTGR